MSQSRRQRSKREGTFLESVKDSLKDLHGEIADLKRMMKDMKRSNVFPTFIPEFHGHWDYWCPQEAWFDGNAESMIGSKAAFFTYQHDVSESEVAGTLVRDTLLAYRMVCADSTPIAAPLMRAIPEAELNLTFDVASEGVVQPASPTHCATCHQGMEECVCFDLLCRNCVKTVSRCSCAEPAVRFSQCSHCGAHPFQESLFDNDPLPQQWECIECHSCQSRCEMVTETATEYFLLQGAIECYECLRVDAQGVLEHCDACDTLCHTVCMKTTSRPKSCHHDHIFHICSACDASGSAVTCSHCHLEKVAEESLLATSERHEALEVAEESLLATNERHEALGAVEGRMNQILDMVDAADSKRVQLSEPVRDLAYAAAKDTYEWFRQSPPTSELKSKVQYLDGLSQKIAKHVDG